MSVRAKFVVVGIMDRGVATKTIYLEPRYDETIPEDQRFYKATPWGRIEMSIDNPKAIEQLSIGRAFYVDFTAADVTQAA